MVAVALEVKQSLEVKIKGPQLALEHLQPVEQAGVEVAVEPVAVVGM
jgi:hypothetical protein